ncbi:hypothetical protein [Rhizobium laguerreae]|uniref:hypothetical protein n=1 Tax=Rhizobium laguerreae TaxID=1076926 RepID=UPI0013897635|nr:hypothetical protein [Rhizobium laguerreae]NDK52263.1 hypothetical protein [Rhizobium laguerreae]
MLLPYALAKLTFVESISVRNELRDWYVIENGKSCQRADASGHRPPQFVQPKGKAVVRVVEQGDG